MKKEHRELVKKLSDYLFECFNKKASTFLVDGIFFGEQHSILISGFMSALANTMVATALTTDNKEIVEETHIYIRKLLKSVPDSNVDITDTSKH